MYKLVVEGQYKKRFLRFYFFCDNNNNNNDDIS